MFLDVCSVTESGDGPVPYLSIYRYWLEFTHKPPLFPVAKGKVAICVPIGRSGQSLMA